MLAVGYTASVQVTPSRPGIASGVLVGGRYRLGEVIGRGGMADVYDGIDERLERAVAVKLLRSEMAMRDDIRVRFQAEARAAAGLSDPNAVAVFDTGEHEGVPFLVMERLPGDTLADYIAMGPIDPEWLCPAAAGVLGALAVAHAAGIVHRDVKPGNILIAADGRAKITDFGIAKSFSSSDEGHRDLTATGQLLGTPAYLAPERLEGAPATARSDLWAFGVVLYEALAGRKPFDGPSPLAVARAVADGAHVPLGTVRPDLDPRLVASVERAMAPDPADRFATADEMAAALTGAAGAATVEDAPRPDGTMILPAGVAPMPTRRARSTHGPVLWTRRSVRVWTLVALAVLALLFLLARPHGPNTDLVRRDTPQPTVSSTPTTTPTTATTAAPAPQPEATAPSTAATSPVRSPFAENPGNGKAKGKGGGKGRG